MSMAIFAHLELTKESARTIINNKLKTTVGVKKDFFASGEGICKIVCGGVTNG